MTTFTTKIAYICDGLVPECSDKPGCFRHAKTLMDNCYHTLKPSHARNGAVLDPENHPERFHQIDIGDKETCWWEGEE